MASAVSTRLEPLERYAVAANDFATRVARSDLRARVPHCPGWTAYDLVVHLANVHAWAATIVETGRSAADQNDEPRSNHASAVSRWYVGKAVDLLQVLRAADPEAPCWNFADGLEGRAGFWQRRQLHETTIHLLDLAQARAEALELDPVVCTDGVDEVLTVFLRRMHQRGRWATLTEPVSLVTTDTDHAWTVHPSPWAAVPGQTRGAEAAPPPPPTVVPGRDHDADTVLAPASVFYPLLWKRAAFDTEVMRVEGDILRVRAFLASALVP